MNWIISDIHGFYYTLKDLVSRVLNIDPDAHFIFVGDYVDRGPYSKEVVEYIIDLQSKNMATCLRGNHDDVIDKLLNNHCLSVLSDVCRSNINDAVLIEWWSVNGLLDTLTSYGVKFTDSTPFAIASYFREAVPESHKSFFKNLLPVWENDTHFCMHAYARNYEIIKFPIKNVSTENLWDRYNRNEDTKVIRISEPTWSKIGVFGHTPVSHYGAVAPIKYGQLRLIDCGVFMGGYLVAFCVENDDWLLQNPSIKDLESKINDDAIGNL